MRPNEIGDGSLGRKGVELHKDRGAVMPEYLATLFWSYSWPGPRHPPRYSAFALNSTTELPLQTSDLTSDREHDTIA
ncbi:hypothetical protein M0804_007887 [Polistes exclamans]|nr:hypothetical protein M0804_007887 [Polistes exclamans]